MKILFQSTKAYPSKRTVTVVKQHRTHDILHVGGIFEFSVPYKYPEDFENDTIPEVVNGDEMGVRFKAWLERDIKQPLNSKDQWERSHGLDLFWKRNFYPHVSMIVNDLHEKGLLPAGECIINIDW